MENIFKKSVKFIYLNSRVFFLAYYFDEYLCTNLPSLNNKSFVRSLNTTPMLSSLRAQPKPYLSEQSTHLATQYKGTALGSSHSSSWFEILAEGLAAMTLKRKSKIFNRSRTRSGSSCVQILISHNFCSYKKVVHTAKLFNFTKQNFCEIAQLG